MNKNERKYIGSVLFYKHVILLVIFLIVLILSALSIRLRFVNSRISEKLSSADLEIQKLEEQLGKMETQGEVIIVEREQTNVSSKSIDDWSLVLVNEKYPIAEDYQVELVSISGGQKIDQRIKEPLEKMFDAMKKEGMSPMVCSGYRTLEKQFDLFEECLKNKLKQGKDYSTAYYETKRRQAFPGTSEHHTGLAVDIVGKSHQSLDSKQENTKEAKWLAEHCAEYGFILRYPKDKIDVTGIEYESWHFRYVGMEAAQYIMENSITLEEYLQK